MTRARYYKNLKCPAECSWVGRLVLLAPIVALLICIALVYGCSGAQKKPALAALECRRALLEPYLGELTPGLVRSTLAGNAAPLVQVLVDLGLSPDEVRAIAKAWHDCVPKKPAEPTPDAGPPKGSSASGPRRIEAF